jgi:hypothetical protein
MLLISLQDRGPSEEHGHCSPLFPRAWELLAHLASGGVSIWSCACFPQDVDAYRYISRQTTTRYVKKKKKKKKKKPTRRVLSTSLGAGAGNMQYYY